MTAMQCLVNLNQILVHLSPQCGSSEQVRTEQSHCSAEQNNSLRPPEIGCTQANQSMIQLTMNQSTSVNVTNRLCILGWGDIFKI